MSVLIKGMEMPQSCYDCPFEESVNFCYGEKGTCPLVPIPHHGRLIDADALIQDKGIDTFSTVFAVANAPTIIPAEDDE